MPGNSSRTCESTWATAIRTAVCTSCPQACITPTSRPLYSALTLEAKGRSNASVTGRASISARSAITGPGLPPRRTPTTPVWATCVRTSRPSRAQVVRHDARRANFAIRQLRMLVNIAPPGNGLLLHFRGQPVDLRIERACRRRLSPGVRRRRQDRHECRQDTKTNQTHRLSRGTTHSPSFHVCRRHDSIPERHHIRYGSSRDAIIPRASCLDKGLLSPVPG